MSNRGKVFIISGPAGSGKTTLIDRLHQEFPKMIKNISYTTRPKRDGEINGQDYFFVSDLDFEKRLKEEEFLEYVELFGYRYGTSKLWIDEKLVEGFSVFLVIDIQGAKEIKALLNPPSIFIKPPSLDVLKERLLKRRTEKEAQLKVRLERAQEELNQSAIYDYQIINDDFETAYNELKSIVEQELN